MKDEKTSSPAPGRIPLKQRLELAHRGLPCSDRLSADRILAIRDLPLEQYLENDPELLFRLRALYSPPPRTFGEAAAVIGALGAQPEDLDYAVDLMQRLARPLLPANQRR